MKRKHLTLFCVSSSGGDHLKFTSDSNARLYDKSILNPPVCIAAFWKGNDFRTLDNLFPYYSKMYPSLLFQRPAFLLLTIQSELFIDFVGSFSQADGFFASTKRPPIGVGFKRKLVISTSTSVEGSSDILY